MQTPQHCAGHPLSRSSAGQGSCGPFSRPQAARPLPPTQDTNPCGKRPLLPLSTVPMEPATLPITEPLGWVINTQPAPCSTPMTLLPHA